MTSNFMDVHVFDGKLQGMFEPVYYNRESEDSIVIKVDSIIRQLKNPMATECVKLIMSQNGNQDNANNIDAFYLFVEVCLRIYEKDEKDLISLLDEQLADCYMLGQCPQGRTTRLLQIYQLLETSDNLKIIDGTVETVTETDEIEISSTKDVIDEKHI